MLGRIVVVREEDIVKSNKGSSDCINQQNERTPTSQTMIL